MEKFNEIAEKVKKLLASFEKEVDDLLKSLCDEDKSKLQTDLKVCTFYENILQANQYLCEVKCMVLQKRHDLHNLKEEAKKSDNKKYKNEKEKLILELYNAEELYVDLKTQAIKKLESIIEKRNKMKFSLDEIEVWGEVQNVIKSVMVRMNM